MLDRGSHAGLASADAGVGVCRCIADGKADRATVLARMRAHITAVVGRYRGRIHAWDVVNEALEEDGTLRRTPWLEAIGEDYIAKAFEFAREADPQAELYYNDYNLWKPAKRAGAIALVNACASRASASMASASRRIGASDGAADRADRCRRSATLAARAASKCMITELDVDVLPREPDMWGADLSRKATIRATTNIYPGRAAGRAAAAARAALRGHLPRRPAPPRSHLARDLLGRHRRAVLAARLSDSRPRQLPAALGSPGTAEARPRRGGRGPDGPSTSSGRGA